MNTSSLDNERRRNGLPPNSPAKAVPKRQVDSPAPQRPPFEDIVIPPRPDTHFSTVAEVAAALRVSKMTVYRISQAGGFPAYRFGRTFRIPTAAVWDYVRGQKVDPDELSSIKAL